MNTIEVSERADIPAIELNDDLAGAVVIDLFELTNVACGRMSVMRCCDRLNVVNQC